MEFHYMGLKNIITVSWKESKWNNEKNWRFFDLLILIFFQRQPIGNTIQFFSSLPNGKKRLKLICRGHCRPLRIENGKLLEWNEESLEWTMKQRKQTAAFNHQSINFNFFNYWRNEWSWIDLIDWFAERAEGANQQFHKSNQFTSVEVNWWLICWSCWWRMEQAESTCLFSSQFHPWALNGWNGRERQLMEQGQPHKFNTFLSLPAHAVEFAEREKCWICLMFDLIKVKLM